MEARLHQAADAGIWIHAKTNGFVIVSKDSDYLRLSVAFGRPPKAIWTRTGNCPTGLVYSLLRDNYDEIEAFGQNPRRSVLELG